MTVYPYLPQKLGRSGHDAAPVSRPRYVLVDVNGGDENIHQWRREEVDLREVSEWTVEEIGHHDSSENPTLDVAGKRGGIREPPERPAAPRPSEKTLLANESSRRKGYFRNERTVIRVIFRGTPLRGETP
jgi:hypothetical protein